LAYSSQDSKIIYKIDPVEITDAAIVLVTLSTNRLKIVLKSEFKWDNNSFKKEDARCVLNDICL
jgi:hypothetical protein